jgi:hypothetical protein
LGEPCSTLIKCSTGLYCDHSKHICKAKNGLGKYCNNNSAECKQNLECLTNTNIFTQCFRPFTCQNLPSESQPCIEKCKEGFYCKREKRVQFID